MEQLSFQSPRNVRAFALLLAGFIATLATIMCWCHSEYLAGRLSVFEFASLILGGLTLLGGIAGAFELLRRLAITDEQLALDREARISDQLGGALTRISSDREAEVVAGCELAIGLLDRLNRGQRLAVEGTIRSVIGPDRWPLNLFEKLRYVGQDGRLKEAPYDPPNPEDDIHADTVEYRLWFSSDPRMRLFGRIFRLNRGAGLGQPFKYQTGYMADELATLPQRSKLRLDDDEEHDLPEPPL